MSIFGQMAHDTLEPVLRAGIGFSDRIFPMLDGSVQVKDMKLAFESAPADQLFWRALHNDEFDLVEMSFAAYCILASRGDTRFVALPIFTSRAFRHNAIYVRADSPLTQLEELAGKSVGLPEYQMTAAVWIRGILECEVGIPLTSITWHAGGVDTPGREDRIPFTPPPGLRVQRIAPSSTLSDMLLHEKLDALISPRAPSATASGRIRRLLANSRAEEIAYYRRRNVFPIMHLLVMRRSAYAQRKSGLRKLYLAFDTARHMAGQRLRDTETQACMLPWIGNEIEATENIMGKDFWPYGFSKNKHCVEQFLRHLSTQGLMAKTMNAQDLFPEELLDT